MKRYIFTADINVDNGFGNTWSSSDIEVDDSFRLIGVHTQFLGNNAVNEGQEYLSIEDLLKQPQLLKRVEAAISGFRAGIEYNKDN